VTAKNANAPRRNLPICHCLGPPETRKTLAILPGTMLAMFVSVTQMEDNQMNIPQTPSPAAQPHTPPAKAARELLDTRPDLASQPFGKLVEAFARGQTIPPQGTSETT
jgi:hypothetical protein